MNGANLALGAAALFALPVLFSKKDRLQHAMWH